MNETTLTIGIVQLLKAFPDLDTAFDELMVKMTNARKLNVGAEGMTFVHAKLDDLKDYVHATKNQEGTTAAELHVLIKAWIDDQEGT